MSVFAAGRQGSHGLACLVAAALWLAAARAQAVDLQAESASVLIGVTTTADAGAGGGFRVSQFDAVGDTIGFDIVPAVVYGKLEVQYSLGRDYYRQCSLYVNGVDVQTLTFTPTGAFTTYFKRTWAIETTGHIELKIDPDDFAANRGDTCAAIDYISLDTAPPASSKLYIDDLGRVIHAPVTDTWGDHYFTNIAQTGYGGGGRRLPHPSLIPNKVILEPGDGVSDDKDRIQAAINQVQLMPLDARGFRGAVLLKAGQYRISGNAVNQPLRISASGVVLRGEGDGPTGTVLLATSTTTHTEAAPALITIAGTGSASQSGATRNITDVYLPSGSRHFHLDDISGLAIGSNIIVTRRTPQNWIDVIGMNLLTNPWTVGSQQNEFERVITDIQGNRITVDVPLSEAFDFDLQYGTVRTFTYSGRIRQCGIENLRGESVFASETDENHTWMFLEFEDLQDGWVRNVTARYFAYSLVNIVGGARNITVQDSSCLDPKSVITGGRRYSFAIQPGQMNLVTRCFARSGRHDFVMGSRVAGPNAFVDCFAIDARSDTGPHHRWSTGTVWDNVFVQRGQINMQNRGNSGSGHGWAGANSMAWNSRSNSMDIQSPPTAVNWSIGNALYDSTGNLSNLKGSGYWESKNVHVGPTSIHAVELDDWLAWRPMAALALDEDSGGTLPALPVAIDARIGLEVPVNVNALGSGATAGLVCALTDVTGINRLQLRLDTNAAQPALTLTSANSGGASSASIPFRLDQIGGATSYTMKAVFEIGASSIEARYRLMRNDIDAVAWEGRSTLARVPAGSLTQLQKTVEASASGTIGDARVFYAVIQRIAAAEGATVRQDAPTATSPGAATLTLRGGIGGAQSWGLLKFTVSGIAEPIIGARLRLRANTLTGGVKVYPLQSDSWSAGSVTWNTKPATGALGWRESAVFPGEFVTLDLSSLVRQNGTYSLALVGDLDLAGLTIDGPAAASNQPQLEIITGAAYAAPSDVWVDYAYAGPEEGTFARPFDTLGEGAAAVAAGGIIRIVAGEGSEVLRIPKAMTLTAIGGVVRVGDLP